MAVITEWHRDQQRKHPHLNFLWTTGDAEYVILRARVGRPISEIAFMLDRTEVEVAAFCKRNGVLIKGNGWR